MKCGFVWTVCTLSFLFVIGVPRTARTAESPSHQWTPPSIAWVLPLTRSTERKQVDPRSGHTLEPDTALVVPADAGDVLRVVGKASSVGFGTGTGETPDAITWWSVQDSSGPIRIPTWSSAQFFAVRGVANESLRVEVAAPLTTASRWHELDHRVDEWLTAGAKGPVPTNLGEANNAIETLETLASLVPNASDDATRAWLWSRWLAHSFRARPLSEPYFSSGSVPLAGQDASPASCPTDPIRPCRIVSAGSKLTFSGQSLDVVRVDISPHRRGAVQVILREGNELLRALRWDPPARLHNDGFAPAQSFRLVPPPGGNLSIEVEVGSVALQVEGFRQRQELGTLVGSRRRRTDALHFALNHAKEPWLTQIVERESTESSLVKLQAPRDSSLAILQAFDTCVHPISVAAGVSACRDLFRRCSAPTSELTAKLWSHALDHLVGVRAWEDPSVDTLVPAGIRAPNTRRVAARLKQLFPPKDGLRPELAWSLEDAAASAPTDTTMTRLARDTWSRETVWAALPSSEMAAHGLSRIEAVTPDAPSGRCYTRTARGYRWTRLGPGEHRLPVVQGEGTHALVLFEVPPDAPLTSKTVQVDGEPLTVHPGLRSSAAVVPGDRVFRIDERGDVLARIPREEAVDCDSIREVSSAEFLSQPAMYEIPSPGRKTIVRIVIEPIDSQPLSLKAQWETGAIQASVFQPGSGAIELEVPSAATSFRLSSSKPAWVRVFARMHAPSGLTPSLTVAQAPSLPQALAQIRSLTEQLDNTTATSHSGLLAQRSKLLRSLGYSSLADLDDLAKTSLEGLIRWEGSSAFLTISGGTKPMIVRDHRGALPALGTVDASRDIRTAYAAFSQGHLTQARDALRSSLHASPSPASLLLAEVSERLGDVQLAARLYEEIGRVHENPAAYEHAALLLTKHAEATGSKDSTMRAWTLALRAKQHSGTPAPFLGKLARAVEWIRPSRIENSSGTAMLPDLDSKLSTGNQVRRALSLAPDDSIVLVEDQRIESRIEWKTPTQLTVTYRCAGSDPARCTPVFHVDSEVHSCPTPSEPGAGSCQLQIPPGPHRIQASLRAPAGTFGWIRLQPNNGPALREQAVGAWFGFSEQEPLRWGVRGPSVLRLVLRNPHSTSAEVTIRTRSSSGRVHIERVDVSPASNGSDSERYVFLDSPDPAELELTAPRGLWVRVAASTVVSAPQPDQLAKAQAPSAAKRSSLPKLQSGDIAEPPGGLPLTALLRTELNFQPLELDQDASPSDTLSDETFTQVSLTLRRELALERAWLSLTLGERFRDGPESTLARGAVSVELGEHLPRIAVLGQAVRLHGTDPAFGYLGTLRIAQHVELGRDLELIPRVAFGLYKTDSTATHDDDVNSIFRHHHPRYLAPGLGARWRPYLDAQFGLDLMAKTMPNLDALESVRGRASFIAVPGRGLWPLIRTSAGLTLRTDTPLRKEAYLEQDIQTSLMWWTWLNQGYRVSFGVEGMLNHSPHAPSTNGLDHSILLFTELLASGNRGLQDFSTSEVFFRDRMEQGSSVQRTRPQGPSFQEGTSR